MLLQGLVPLRAIGLRYGWRKGSDLINRLDSTRYIHLTLLARGNFYSEAAAGSASPPRRNKSGDRLASHYEFFFGINAIPSVPRSTPDAQCHPAGCSRKRQQHQNWGKTHFE